MKHFFPLFLLSLLLMRCTGGSEHTQPSPAGATAASLPAVFATVPEKGFNDYWFQGKAEIAVYDVTQDRYGEMRPAQQVMVFVTEDFSARKQVKLDAPEQAGADRVPVLKLNTIRRFHTGIYDYSLMQSVFTPMDATQHPRTLKTTTTVQDWCGHVFTQFNLADQLYRVREFSYFESEGDTAITLPAAVLEDELWVRIRLNPGGIPTGPIGVIPSAFYSRLRHQPIKVEQATLSLEAGGEESTLRLQYRDIPRQLSIRFATAFPHRILGWEETDGDRKSSQGKLRQAFQSAYWSEHDHGHDALRDSLKLNF